MFSEENIDWTSRKCRREISEPKQKQCTEAPAPVTYKIADVSET